MTTPLGCPRCHNENVSQKEVPLLGIELLKHSCTNCGTRWIFEEDLTAIIIMASKAKNTA